MDSIGTLLSERQAATILGLTPFALRKWRQQRRGPEFIRLSPRCVRYKLCDLEAYIEARRTDPVREVQQ